MNQRPNSFFARFGPLILLLVGAAFPLVLIGSVLAMRTNHNDVQEWLPEGFKETQEYQQFQREFSSDTFILASWEGCTLDDPRLGEVAAKLEQASEKTGTAAEQAESRYFTSVVSGRSLVDKLAAPPISVSWKTAVTRLQKSFIGDGEQTCLALTVSDYGKLHLRPMLAAVEAAAVSCGVPADTLRLAGPPVDNVAIDVVSEAHRELLMVLASVVGLGLSWWYLRDVKLAVMVFIGGAYSATLCLAVVWLFGGIMNSVLFTMPAVVYTAGLSCAIHIVNYYRYAQHDEGVVGAPERALKAAWVPCLLSAGTTALGLFSLCSSEIVPIRTFGFYTGVGVLAAVGLIYLYLPAALQIWPPPEYHDPEDPPADGTVLDTPHHQRMRHIGTLLTDHPRLIWTTFFVLFVVCGLGLLRTTTTVNLMSLFSPRAHIIDSYRWMEAKIGAMAPMEVVLRVDEETCNLTLLERLQLVGRLQEAIQQAPHVGSTMSAATFVPELNPPKASGLRGVLLRKSTWQATINKRLEAHRDEIVAGDYMVEQPVEHQQLWRISVRVAALENVDYGQFIEDLRQHVDPVLAEEREAGTKGLEGMVYTGLVPVIYRAERALLDGLITSFFHAFLMMGTMMSLVYRDIRAGFFTMLPNVWPVAVVFGLLGWCGVALDIGVMMTASVAMGVCVDDTVHFVNWYRRATRMGLKQREAAILAFENSAGAIYQSTIIVALGLAVFALSEFMPTRRFGYLMGVLLFFGLVADLVLTPAMLGGGIGRFFTKNCTPDTTAGGSRNEGHPAPDEVSSAAK